MPRWWMSVKTAVTPGMLKELLKELIDWLIDLIKLAQWPAGEHEQRYIKAIY